MLKSIDNDRYMAECEALAHDWTREDISQLYDFLSSRLGKQIMGHIILGAKSMVSAIGVQDFTTEDGVKQALSLQGQIRGLNGAVESLIGLVNDAVENEETSND